METAVIQKFGDGEYRFFMSMKQIVAFERDHETILDFYGKLAGVSGFDEDGKCHYLGPGGPSVTAIRDFVRLALDGGNHGFVDGQEIEVGPIKAGHLVDDYCYPARPLEEAVALAALIAVHMVKGVRLKKKVVSEDAPTKGSKKDKSSSTAANSGSTGDTSA